MFKIKKLRILNYPGIDPNTVLDWDTRTEEILSAMCNLGIWPQLVLVEVELRDANNQNRQKNP